VVLDAVSGVEQFVDVFLYVYILFIFLLILTSWIRLPYGFNPLLRFLHDVCDPYLNIWRRILPFPGPLDFSPMVGVLFLVVVMEVLNGILGRLH
jgi:YggT family protein